MAALAAAETGSRLPACTEMSRVPLACDTPVLFERPSFGGSPDEGALSDS